MQGSSSQQSQVTWHKEEACWHQSNHIQVVYAPDAKAADRALAAKASMAAALGIKVWLCGEAHNGARLAERLGKV